HVLRECGRSVTCGGNIGAPVLDLDMPGKEGVFVLELSSYQLDLCPDFAPDIGVLLNITPDHLDRHGTMENYIAAKARIFNGAGTAVIAMDDDITRGIAQQVRAAGAREVVEISMRDDLGDVNGAVNLKGDHNRQNMAAVLAVALK